MFGRAKKPHQEGEVEANLLPVMNVMFLLIPALLLAMEVAPFTMVPVQAPNWSSLTSNPSPTTPQEPLRLRVIVREDGFTARYGSSPESERKIDIPLGADGKHDFGALEGRAAELKALFPEDAVVNLTAENNIEYGTLVHSMDALRGSKCSLEGAFMGETVPAECYFWNVVVESGAA
jgi:biopolymer transport protein ExbD